MAPSLRVDSGQTEVKVKVADADVHPAPRSFAELRERVPEPWRSRSWPDQVFDEIRCEADRCEEAHPRGAVDVHNNGQMMLRSRCENGVILRLSKRRRRVRDEHHFHEIRMAGPTLDLTDCQGRLTRANPQGAAVATMPVVGREPRICEPRVRSGAHRRFVLRIRYGADRKRQEDGIVDARNLE